MKHLIGCPRCEAEGRRNIFGEIYPDGSLGVMRFHNGITRIVSDSFTIICDKCNETVFYRGKEVNESDSVRVKGVHRGTFIQAIGTFGLGTA